MKTEPDYWSVRDSITKIINRLYNTTARREADRMGYYMNISIGGGKISEEEYKDQRIILKIEVRNSSTELIHEASFSYSYRDLADTDSQEKCIETLFTYIWGEILIPQK